MDNDSDRVVIISEGTKKLLTVSNFTAADFIIQYKQQLFEVNQESTDTDSKIVKGAELIAQAIRFCRKAGLGSESLCLYRELKAILKGAPPN